MSADHCPLCNGKLGSMFGVEALQDTFAEKLDTLGLYTPGMCRACATKAKDKEIQRLNAQCESLKNQMQALQAEVFGRIHVSTLDMPRDGAHVELGLVSGHSILGTGPLSSLLASVTDLFGIESGAYQEKVCKAQDSALRQAKHAALTRGGNAIFGVRINVTEATAGDGMIMVSVAGTAVQTPNPGKNVPEFQRLAVDTTTLQVKLEEVHGLFVK